jgi:hypothetical protein
MQYPPRWRHRHRASQAHETLLPRTSQSCFSITPHQPAENTEADICSWRQMFPPATPPFAHPGLAVSRLACFSPHSFSRTCAASLHLLYSPIRQLTSQPPMPFGVVGVRPWGL